MLAAALGGQSGVSARQTSQELSHHQCAHLSVHSTIRSLLSYQNSSWESPPSGGG